LKNKILVTLVIFTCLAVCFGSNWKKPPKLPRTALGLIKKLKETKGIYGTFWTKLNYVKEKDLPYLVKLLDSNEPCAHAVSGFSSDSPSGNSTVGNEAAFLIESFWKRYYPVRSISRGKGIPTKLELKRWYKKWAHLKKAEKRTANNLKLLNLNEIPDEIKEFVADPRTREASSYHFKNFKITQKEIENILKTYHKIDEERWRHGYSHVMGGDRTGHLILKNGIEIEWFVKPGGLATLEFYDGRILYLAKGLTLWKKKAKQLSLKISNRNGFIDGVVKNTSNTDIKIMELFGYWEATTVLYKTGLKWLEAPLKEKWYPIGYFPSAILKPEEKRKFTVPLSNYSFPKNIRENIKVRIVTNDIWSNIIETPNPNKKILK